MKEKGSLIRVEQFNSCALPSIHTHLHTINFPLLIDKSVDTTFSREVWSIPSLLSSIGNKQVSLASSSTGLFDYTEDGERNFSVTFMPFVEAVRKIHEANESGEACYIRQVPLLSSSRDKQALPAEMLIPTSMVKLPHFWIGSKGCITPLHYDSMNNFLTQMQGRKRIILFPPSEYSQMYPFGFGHPFLHVCRPNPEVLERDKFPNFPLSLALTIDLQPGQTLFIPAFWWHYVRSLDFTLSVNEWWPARAEQIVVPSAIDLLRTMYTDGKLGTWLVDEMGLPLARIVNLAEQALESGQLCLTEILVGVIVERAIYFLTQMEGISCNSATRTTSGYVDELLSRNVLCHYDASQIKSWLMVSLEASKNGSVLSAYDLSVLVKAIVSFVSYIPHKTP